MSATPLTDALSDTIKLAESMASTGASATHVIELFRALRGMRAGHAGSVVDWVRMTENEPPRPGKYLACFHDGEMGVILWPGEWKKRSVENTLYRCEITHWAYLPTRPK